jgi:phosphoribosylaminoimidazole carboxylase/phosphoribosylaminoimidazole-succinocarboxamide synthase
LRKINEGKTKIIWATDDPSFVIIESKNDLTKGDGTSRIFLERKGELSNRITCNCFEALNEAGLITHFKERVDTNKFRALFVKMYPIEVVARRKAYGSYLKRNPWVKENFRFKDIDVGYHFKCDALHDPYILKNKDTGWYDMYDPKQPISAETYLGEVPRDAFMPSYEELMEITKTQITAFETLEQKWKLKKGELIDMKCEYGKNFQGEIVLADVIDNDSWRIRYLGEEKSKEVFRQMDEVGEAEEQLLTDNLIWVAEQTDSFPTEAEA